MSLEHAFSGILNASPSERMDLLLQTARTSPNYKMR